jgi:hypothetical protein
MVPPWSPWTIARRGTGDQSQAVAAQLEASMPAPRRDPLSKHRKHLAEVPDDFLQEKLKLLQFDPDEFAKLSPLIVSGQRGPVTITATAAKPAKLLDVKQHVRTIAPGSLDELKELAGQSNRAIERDPDPEARLPKVDDRSVAALEGAKTFKDLDGVQRDVFWLAAQRLLHGSSAPDVLTKAGYKQVSELMLNLAGRLAILLATDLIVTTGQRVNFSGLGVLYFNNVLVYGTGSICLGGNTKMHAYQVSHV